MEERLSGSVRLTIVMPVYVASAGGLEPFERGLAALAGQMLAGEQVWVVDDTSPGEWGRELARAAELGGARYVRLEQNRGPAAARNAGAALAEGDVLLFLDADVEVQPEALARIRARFAADPELDAVMGSYDDAPAATAWVSRFRNLLHCYVHRESAGPATTFWGGCGAMRRERFLALGGFDERYRQPSIEDVELGCRLHGAGGRIWLDPTIAVKHHKRWTLPSMVRTDLLSRAVPWAELMREHGLPQGLNFGWRDRVVAGLVGLLPVLLLLALRQGGAFWAWPCGLLALVAVLKGGLLVFLARRGGVAFAGASLGWYVLHVMTGVMGFLVGTLAVERKRDPWLSRVAVGLLLALVALQGGSGAWGGEFDRHEDDAPHYVSALAVHDFVVAGPVLAPGQWLDWLGQFYLHYPKMTLGQWPPLYPLALAGWMLLFGVSRAAVLGYQLVLGWMALVLLYRLWRPLAGAAVAIAAVGLLAVTPMFLAALGSAMAEMTVLCAAVLLLVATEALVRRPQWGTALRAAGALLLLLATKGTGVLVAAGPALALLPAGRWRRLPKRVWVAGAVLVGLGMAWYAAMGRVRNWGGMSLILPWPGWMLPDLGGWGVLGFAVRGISGGSVALAAAGILGSGLLGAVAVRALLEPRHWMMVLPALFSLAVLGFCRLRGWPFRVVAGVAVLGLFPWGLPPAGRGEAANLLRQLRRPDRMLVALPAAGEGGWVAQVAMTEARPGSVVMRGSKVLAESGWSGYRYRLLARSAEEVRERLDALRVNVVVGSREPLPEEPTHVGLVRKAMAAGIGWKVCAQAGYLVAYCRTEAAAIPAKPLELNIRGRVLRER